MTLEEVLHLLQESQDERGIAQWDRRKRAETGWGSYGIGLTKLRSIAKRIGRDHGLSRRLWEYPNYDARVVGLLVGDPKQLTRDEAERQVDQLGGGMLAHVFSSCDATLAKSPFAFELACAWCDSPDPVRRRCAYGLLYELSKKNPKGMDDDYLLRRIDHIRETIHGEEMWVREAMSAALMGIGKRNTRLNQAAIRAARAIGPVAIDYGDDNRCEPLDVLKHLTNDALQARLRSRFSS